MASPACCLCYWIQKPAEAQQLQPYTSSICKKHINFSHGLTLADWMWIRDEGWQKPWVVRLQQVLSSSQGPGPVFPVGVQLLTAVVLVPLKLSLAFSCVCERHTVDDVRYLSRVTPSTGLQASKDHKRQLHPSTDYALMPQR